MTLSLKYVLIFVYLTVHIKWFKIKDISEECQKINKLLLYRIHFILDLLVFNFHFSGSSNSFRKTLQILYLVRRSKSSKQLATHLNGYTWIF